MSAATGPGYNSAPVVLRHCRETGCLREQREFLGERHELCRGPTPSRVPLSGGPMEGIKSTCCTLSLRGLRQDAVNARVSNLVLEHDYPDPLAKAIFQEAGVTISYLDKP